MMSLPIFVTDIDDGYDDYNVKGLDMLMTYQKGQDYLFGRHNERKARASKCSRGLIELRRDPTVKCVLQLPKEEGKDNGIETETQLAAPEQQGSTIYASTWYYSQLARTIDEVRTIDWDTSYQSLLYCTEQ
jgi:hypothetical protein